MNTVLMVDPNTTDADLLEEAVREVGGVDLLRAESGEDAVDLLASGRAIDAVLLDLQLPGMSSTEVLTCIRGAAGQQPHVILFTTDDCEHALQVLIGAPDDCRSKPTRFAGFLDLARHLAGGCRGKLVATSS